jgi:hypothetical protein
VIAPRLVKPALVLLTVAALAVAISACTFYKPGSFSLGQPSGIGDVRVHFMLCTELDEDQNHCVNNEGGSEDQALLGIAVPKGAAAPTTITAVPVAGGPTITYTRNDQVAQEISQVSQGTDNAWPPEGTEGIGYLSAPFKQEDGAWEWTVDASFGLPAVAADGGIYGGPFPVSLYVGARKADASNPADRPVECHPEDEPWSLPGDADEATCEFAEKGSLGTANLRISPPAQSLAFLGGKAAIAFPFEFAGTPPAPLAFGLTATSTLPKAKLTLSAPTFAPGPPAVGTNRSPAEARTVNVQVPKTAKLGLYTVTLTATTPQGGTVSQVATLKVSKANVKLGKLKLNEAKGTATLLVKVPAAGSVSVYGKGLAKTKRVVKGPKLLVPVKPNAKSKAQLAETGKAKVKAKISFKPTDATPVVKSKGLTLKKSLGG